MISAWQARGREFVGTARGRWEERRARGWNLFDWFSPRAMFRLLLPVASLVVALLVAEGLARIAFRTVRSSGDARTFFAGRNEPIHLNNLGFRDGDVPAKGPRFRIVIIGDSITWGAGLPESRALLESAAAISRQQLRDRELRHSGPQPARTCSKRSSRRCRSARISSCCSCTRTISKSARWSVPERGRCCHGAGLDEWLLQSSAVYTMLSAQWPGVQEKLGLLETYYHYMHRYLKDPNSLESKAGLALLRQFVTAREQPACRSAW